MVAAETPVCDFGRPAPDFDLKGVDGRAHTLGSVRGASATLVMFICNHCPYVKAVIDRIVADCRDLEADGVGSVAIMSNDWAAHPADSPENMAEFARTHGFPFPYLIDGTQDVARAYDAVCTPDFFGYNASLKLQYRGRLDASRARPVPNARRDLVEAMRMIARTGRGPEDQIASMGCSIKWRA